MSDDRSIKSFLYGSRGDGREGGDYYFDVVDAMMNNYNRTINGYRPFPDVADRANAVIYRVYSGVSGNGRKRLLLHDGILRYAAISRAASGSYDTAVIGTGMKSFYNSLLKRVPYCSTFREAARLYEGIIADDEGQLADSVRRIEKVVKKVDPDLMVLNDASLPYTRALTLVARETGVPTVVIQHGVYQKNVLLGPEKDVDYAFVWGNFFKRLYLDKKIKTDDRVKVLGYPYEITVSGRPKGKSISVYYLGQNWETIDYRYMDVKLETLSGISRICKKAGFDFTYRPHPGEEYLGIIREKVGGMKICKNETLKQSLARGDIFVSFNSTALIEASLHSKFAIQLKNHPFETDDYAKIGMCARSCPDMESLESLLAGVRSRKDLYDGQKPFTGNDFIDIPAPGPGERFLELVREIVR